MLSVGVDLVYIERIATFYAKYGDHFLKVVCTPLEREYCANRSEHLAGLFAVKEAVAKALGIGLAYLSLDGIYMTEVEIQVPSQCQVSIRLHDRAREYAEKLGVNEWSISLARTGEYALATAVAM
jgi:holo-[acyl-carrier protein] synthase